MCYLEVSVWSTHPRSSGFEECQTCTNDGQQAAYTTLHIINHVHIVWERGEGGGCSRWGTTAHRWDGAEEEEDEERRGRGREWRQKRRVRKPQITTINHQAVNIFTCWDALLLAAAWDLCVYRLYFCVCMYVCVCLFCVAQPGLLSLLSHCLRLSLNWRHKQQQLRNHPRQQEAGRCVNSPSTKLGCARLQKRLGSHISLFNHKHLHEPGWKHTLGFSQGFALDAGQGLGSHSALQNLTGIFAC